MNTLATKLACLVTLAAAAALGGCSTPHHAPIAAADAATPTPPATVTPAVRKAITAALAQMAPQASIQAIAPAPIAGLYQVVAQGQVLYMTGDGRYVIQGDAYDVATHTPLNTETMNRLRRAAIARLQPDQMIRFAPPHPKYTVTVFTDVDCAYCKAFH
ncbi:MAG TPA: DsbC family protein, partial [Rhodanobacteraceae bacterium]